MGISTQLTTHLFSELITDRFNGITVIQFFIDSLGLLRRVNEHITMVDIPFLLCEDSLPLAQLVPGHFIIIANYQPPSFVLKI